MGAKGVQPPAYLLVAIAAMVALHLLCPGPRVVPWPWRLLGVLPVRPGDLADGQDRGGNAHSSMPDSMASKSITCRHCVTYLSY
jgi:hypothetical protein